MIPSTESSTKSYIGSLFSWMTNTIDNNENENDIPYVYQVSVKNTHKTNNKERNPKKISKPSLIVLTDGCEGDYNEYRTKHKKSTNDRAVSLMTTQLLDAFNQEEWPVLPGDLGENVTITGDITFEIEEKYSIGTVILQITEEIEPCNKLMFLPYVGRENKLEFFNMLKGRRGWYAKVLTEGIIVPGDKVIKLN